MCILQCVFINIALFKYSVVQLNNVFVTSPLVVFDDLGPPKAQLTVAEYGGGVYFNTGGSITQDRNMHSNTVELRHN